MATAQKSRELTAYKMYIGGEWVEAEDGATFESQNPYLSEPWAEVPEGSPDDVDRAVRAARGAFDRGEWPKTTGRERSKLLRRLSELVAKHADRLGEIETRDNGKLLREMQRAMPCALGVVRLLRGRSRQDQRRGHWRLTSRTSSYTHAQRAGRSRCRRAPLELAPCCCWRSSSRRRSRPAARSSPSPPSRTPASTLEFCPPRRRSRIPARSLQRRHRLCRATVCKALVIAPRRRQDRFHGLDDDRYQRRARSRRESLTRHTRARRKVAKHRLRRCRSGSRNQRRRGRDPRRHRSDLHRRLPPDRARERARRAGRASRCASRARSNSAIPWIPRPRWAPWPSAISSTRCSG